MVQYKRTLSVLYNDAQKVIDNLLNLIKSNSASKAVIEKGIERAIRLMASKLAAATLVEGNFTDEGLAALGDDADMTSQLAKELTMGIKNEVEDVAEIFKRMAILKDADEPAEDMSDYIISDEQVRTVNSIANKLEMARMLAKQARGIKESTTVNKVQFHYEGDQITLFDVA